MSANIQEAVDTIGLAVFNGGVTTFLALVLLGASSSHVFLSFFKVTIFVNEVICAHVFSSITDKELMVAPRSQ